jgi:WD40 repeat protein
VHILEFHPTNPSLAFSASYDGSLVVWDAASGAALRRFSSRQTRPDGRSWPDLLPFADGHFAPDGASISVTGR